MEMRSILTIVVGTTVLFANAVNAQSTSRPSLDALKARLDFFEQFYGDVPSAIDCNAFNQSVATTLICRDEYLMVAELLNTRSMVYAIENATKMEVEHRKWRGALPIHCLSDECIFRWFRDQTNDSLGGMSPYP
ncbi:hypothetical protein [Zavarzinia sp. CC-PAN008]|uniref:hypothetical protein n=1 Tax=Zavarzinia sp. CC-PAN008 TaxID=3243332 RepID=UPI003F7461DA